MGIKSGLTQAFVIDNKTKERLCTEDPKSQELLKPFLEGKDLKRWHQESRHLWIIYIPKNKINIDDYLAIKNWLLPFKEKLEKRATKQEWFELQQAQEAYAQIFEKPKIVYPDISSSNCFFLDASGNYFANTGYMLPATEQSAVALLNSRVFWFDYCGKTPMVRGGFARFFLNT